MFESTLLKNGSIHSTVFTSAMLLLICDGLDLMKTGIRSNACILQNRILKQRIF